ncbi:PREDICTED: E3 ubiquitin-protein ligase hrd-like protein 1 [Papilio xuthus]|uniref:E3 ubiquitin-protein ligase hrd-like protein 1 n=1 Tax=Papilio xuthus TaxID=66420 RepID=A0AAJ7E4J4_PAPXU|nr:PREDICTED: E3 ubiquitin-protein ligase hrd-like protein 1 [Papilio xuthus]
MPVTLVDRLPLPNLKVYTAGSVLLLSVAVYYAVSVTNDPNWRTNTTVQALEGAAQGPTGDAALSPPPLRAPLQLTNDTGNVTEQMVEVISFMMQEPLCIWTLVNGAYCALGVAGCALRRLVFGRLRVAEAQRIKDKFWNYVFYKFIFVFGVVNVQYMDEVLLWCSWFTLLGCLHLLAQLCKDRFEYLSSSPQPARWAHARLLALLAGVLGAAGTLLAAAARWGLPVGRDTFAFMAAECVLVGVTALHVVARFVLRARDADPAGPAAYYTHLVFDSVSLATELAHVAHMVVHCNALVSMASLVLLMQLRHLLHALLARLRRHRIYTALAHHMRRNYPMASREEVEENEDNCAICWEPMKEARKLPCSHLFHKYLPSLRFLRTFLLRICLVCRKQKAESIAKLGVVLFERGTSFGGATVAPAVVAHRARASGAACCSSLHPLRPLRPPPLAPHDPHAPHGPQLAANVNRANHFFHFDGSRYVSWLPSFSVEVRRVRADAPPDRPADSQLEAMARQVQQVFPQFSLDALSEDLAHTRSPDRTVDNILAGRLLPHPHQHHQQHQHHQRHGDVSHAEEPPATVTAPESPGPAEHAPGPAEHAPGPP